jgi:heme-degrading monooxygenase HmoA
MITILCRMKVKTGRDDEFAKLVRMLSQNVPGECEGCINYIYLRQSDEPSRFALFEQWRDRGAVNAYLDWLKAVLDPPRKGRYGFLPANLTDYFEDLEIKRHDILK